MAYYLTCFSTIIFSILLIIPIIESSRCTKNYNIFEWHLNSSLPFDLNALSNDSNNNINQNCLVKLSIDFNTGLVNGSLKAENQSYGRENRLDIVTIFFLNDTSIKVNITYMCSMFDYCDLEFVREILSPALTVVQMKSIRERLAARLYNSNNTDPVKCSNNSSCPENTSFCKATYSHEYGSKLDETEEVKSECAEPIDDEPIFIWTQDYIPFDGYSWEKQIKNDFGVFLCNIPNCGSNRTVIETVQWLTHEYILPLKTLVFNRRTTTLQSTTTTRNHTLSLFKHFNIIILCFEIILFLH